MTFDIDLAQFPSGTQHKPGPDRAAIRAKHRQKFLDARSREHKPARPETMARLARTLARAKRVEDKLLRRAWQEAIAVIDASESPIRDLIERSLADVAGVKGVRISDAMQRANTLSAKIMRLRTKAFKDAFRLLRKRVGDIKILDLGLSKWAQYFADEDMKRIDTVIRSGLMTGLPNTEIARSVIGSIRLRGVDGATEVTRQRISHLARVALKPRKR